MESSTQALNLAMNVFSIRNILLLLALTLSNGCVLPPSDIPLAPHQDSPAVVFDIDGTLTPDLLSIHTPRKGSAQAVQHYADNGYAIIYLSARVRWLQSGIPEWLEENGFPNGNVHVPQTFSERNDSVTFKSRILNAYQSKGWQLFSAYGDSSTDFEAYNSADIPSNRVFALKRNDEDACQPGIWAACLPSWPPHLIKIQQMLTPSP